MSAGHTRAGSKGGRPYHAPFLALEGLSKGYPAPEQMRFRRLFARLGGLQLEDLLAEVVEVDEDDDLAPDEEEQTSDRGGVGRLVIDGVSLEASGGSCIALVGPEASGKTLLLKLIAGIVAPSEGRIVLRGRVAPALDVLARTIPKGESLQSALLHVGAVAGVSPRLLRAHLDEIGEFLALPQLRSARTSTLEKRQRAEIVLATMLCLDPDLLLIDIPIGRDSFGERCLERIEELRHRGSLVIVEARDAAKLRPLPDRVVHLICGRIAADEPWAPPPPRVKTRPE